MCLPYRGTRVWTKVGLPTCLTDDWKGNIIDMENDVGCYAVLIINKLSSWMVCRYALVGPRWLVAM